MDRLKGKYKEMCMQFLYLLCIPGIYMNITSGLLPTFPIRVQPPTIFPLLGLVHPVQSTLLRIEVLNPNG